MEIHYFREFLQSQIISHEIKLNSLLNILSKGLKANTRWRIEDECNIWGDTYLLSGEGT
jgi:hypothetical protein